MEGPRRILFVCLGNICRSPLAEGVMKARLAASGVDPVEIESAGTGGWHVGAPPDPRAIAAAARRGVDLSALRARQVRRSDFDRFGLILAMDRSNLVNLSRLAPPGCAARIAMITDFAGAGGPDEIDDPYYGGPDGFEATLDTVERCCGALVEAIR
ncbi:MAG: low molecular weight protein-tyrosine-phosphatase [Pseudomonadota bacterium]